MPITLSNGREWRSQHAAREHFRKILYRYETNDIVSDPIDHDDLLALLERYDATITSGPSKLGLGVKSFQRRQNRGEGWTTPGFWVLRTDGTETDFSFPTAITGKPKPPSQEFSDACRAAVATDLAGAKKRHFREYGDADGCVECELTGARLTFQEAHLDHAYPSFGHLVVAFRAARQWHDAIPRGVLTAAADEQTTTSFAEPAIAEAFRQFHHAAATMRVIAAKRNLSMASAQRRPKVKQPVRLD